MGNRDRGQNHGKDTRKGVIRNGSVAYLIKDEAGLPAGQRLTVGTNVKAGKRLVYIEDKEFRVTKTNLTLEEPVTA